MPQASFDGTIAKDPWRVNVYVDESKPAQGCPWLYIGAVVIPTSLEAYAISRLQQDRQQANYHRELHFQNLKMHPKRRLGELWLSRVLYGYNRTFHFHLLGIDTRAVDKRRFGDTPKIQHAQLYARQFRTAISYAVKATAQKREPIVQNLFHDQGDMQSHDVFAWHSQWRLTQDHGIRFEEPEVTFVDSNHELERSHPKASQFVQLADLATGAFRQCIDSPSNQRSKKELGLRVAPLLSRLMDPQQRRNPNSRFDHLGRVSISFWPRPDSRPGEVAFYRSRLLKGTLETAWGTQQSLFDLND